MYNLICFSHLRWEFVWQRPQHLLSRLARHYRILFVEEPLAATHESAPRLEAQPANVPNIQVIRLHAPVREARWIGHGDPAAQPDYTRLLSRLLKNEDFDDPALWLYTPMALDFVDDIPHRLLVFDVMDELSAFKGAPAQLIEREKELLRRADLVFTGGASLYRSKAPCNSNTYLFSSGVEIDHFAQAAARDRFAPPAEIAGLSGPVLGYFGVIDERMDLPLLAHLASTHPDWNIVLVGPVVKISHDELPQADNLLYCGMKRYEELPAYLAHFDVALIPFALNEATRFLSPTKTLEYMAAHKPIVSTPIHDVIELYGEVVRIGRTPQEFVAQVEEALKDDGRSRRIKEQVLLGQHTWDSIAHRMNQLMTARLNTIPCSRKPAAVERSIVLDAPPMSR